MQLTQLAHEQIRPHLRPGDRVVDATVGNGHDTLFLAQRVGLTGHVDGFDLQAQALARTRERLTQQRIEHVTLYLEDHARMDEFVIEPVQVIMFNLGYLPGGDKSMVTKTPSTLKALEAARTRLAHSGIITVMAYRGHDGGSEEAQAVRERLRQWEDHGFSVQEHHGSSTDDSPILYIASTKTVMS